MRLFNINSPEEIKKLYNTPAGVMFTEHDLWSLENHKFMGDLMLFRLCNFIKGPNVHIVDPQLLNRLVDIGNLKWNVENIVKRRKELGGDKAWSARLDAGQTLVLLFNFPVNAHWFSTHISLSPNRNNIHLRFYNSLRHWDALRTTHAKLITQLLHLLGCNPSSRPVLEVTAQHNVCLQQRLSRNLCGIHCVMRVWLVSTNQQGDDTQVSHALVDRVREYCLLAIFNNDPRVCYELTEEERHANDFSIKGDRRL